MKVTRRFMVGLALLVILCGSPVWAGRWDVTPTGIYGNGALAFDSLGRPTYAHSVGAFPYQPAYAAREAGVWTDTAITGSSGSSSYFGLAYAPNGEPGIGHQEWVSSNNTAWYAYRSGGSWLFERVSPGEGSHVSLAYAPDGSAAMAYMNYDDPDGAGWSIDYAQRTGTDSWTVETVALARYDPSGHNTSLTFLPGTGEPATGFLYGFDPDAPVGSWTSELRYAYRSGATWNVENVDNSSSVVGRYHDLSVDPAGNPAMSYYDVMNDQLKFAYRTGLDSWTTEVVDTDGDVGRFSSLAFMSDGTAAIAYTDMTNKDLKYAVWNGTGWDIERIAPEMEAGYYAQLLFDVNDQPLITFAAVSDGLVYQAVPVPEPITLIYFGTGLVCLLGFASRKKKEI